MNFILINMKLKEMKEIIILKVMMKVVMNKNRILIIKLMMKMKILKTLMN